MDAIAGGRRSMLQIKQELIPPDVVVLHMSGRISMGKPCQEIETQIDELMRQKTTKLILDLSEVQRVDSTGFGTIVMCARKFNKAGGELRVAGAKGIVEEIAHTSNLPTIIPFHPTVEEAAAGFAPAVDKS
jgi:anti-sigma B factor antagonist